MINFIELVSELVANEDFNEKYADFIEREMAGIFPNFPPDEQVTRFRNVPLGFCTQAKLKVGEIIVIDGTKFSVQTIGPKEFTLNGNWTQDIYVIRQ